MFLVVCMFLSSFNLVLLCTLILNATSHIDLIKEYLGFYKHKQITNVYQFASTFGLTCGGLLDPVCI